MVINFFSKSKIKYYKILFFVIFCSLFFAISSQAAKNAIGIRVARNSEHLSPSEWYDKYAPNWYGNAGGGPSSMSMGGYEAVSVGSCDSGLGETVYVNAANISGGDVYTNIYIISCPVGADQDVLDIFSQLIANWDFNINVADPEERLKLQRDTKRLADLNSLKNIIDDYQAINPKGKYPALAGGTYKAGQSISYWGSWQGALGKELGATLPIPPEISSGWSPLVSLKDWSDKDGNKVWPANMLFPTGVGVDYTPLGCREVVVLKDQSISAWCEGGCSDCPPLKTTPEQIVADNSTVGWVGAVKNPVTIGFFDNGVCRDLLAIQGSDYTIKSHPVNPTCDARDVSPNSIVGLAPDWPEELQNPTSIDYGVDYNDCEHIFVVKDNRWGEFTKNTTASDNCSYAGWTPVADLTSVLETFSVAWPQDIQNPDDISMAWDSDGKRHIFAFKGDKYREYIDINRPYIYKTTDGGVSYSLCTYFEATYPTLANFNCVAMQSTNHQPVIADLKDRNVITGDYFQYDIIANDLDGDTLTWTFTVSGVAGTFSPGPNVHTGGTWDIYFANTAQSNIKKIYSTAPATLVNKTITITVTDSGGATDTASFSLATFKSGVHIDSDPVESLDIFPGSIIKYQYNVVAVDDGGYYPLTYSWSGTFPPGLNGASINSTTGEILGSPTVAGSYPVIITATNQAGHFADQSFTITITDGICKNGILSTYGIGTPSDSGYYEECDDGDDDKANQCDASGVNGFGECTLTFCGDGVKQTPNGRGFGPNPKNNPALYPSGFFEQCDDGTTNGVVDAKPTDPQANTPDSGSCIIDSIVGFGCTNAICGDGYFTSGVDTNCDDGDADNTDRCDTSGNAPFSYGDCTFTFCGDGIKQNQNGVGAGGLLPANNGVEQCDDGIASGGADLCDTNQVNPSNTRGRCTLTYCGDKTVQSPNGEDVMETCDDANAVNTDQCDTTNISGSGVCQKTFCGDNVVQLPNGLGTGGIFNDGYEECDINSDDCDHIPLNPNSKGNCTFTFCGDGATQTLNHYGLSGLGIGSFGDETCDDGTAPNGCDSMTCSPEYGWYCNTSSPSSCWTTCGDALTALPVEGCDTGTGNNTALCNMTAFGGRPSCSKTICGDGVIQNVNGVGLLGKTGVGDEECDDSADGDNTDTCYDNCTFTFCGDNIRQSPNGRDGINEQCDDGDAGGDGCNNCVAETGWSCPSGGGDCTSICGDGNIVGSETCDDGVMPAVGGDGCSASCQIESGATCFGTTNSVCNFCGNGVIEGNEVCDTNLALTETCLSGTPPLSQSYSGQTGLGLQCNASTDCTTFDESNCTNMCVFDISSFDSCTFAP